MNSRFSIHAVLIDTQNDNKKTHLFAKADTIANHTDIFQLTDEMIDERRDIDAQLKDLFGSKADYKIEILSDLIVKLTDELGGIDVNGRHINGTQALQLICEDRFDDVIDAIFKALGKKNLLFTIPGLLNTLKDSYTTDLPMADALKTFVSEIPDLNKWKIDLIKVNDRTQIR